MPKMATVNKKDQDGSQKRVRVVDPADIGSQAKPYGSPKYSDIPSMYSKFLVDKIDKYANFELVEASQRGFIYKEWNREFLWSSRRQL